MFDFEKLEVYQIIQGVVTKVFKFLKSGREIDEELARQLKKSASSILLNLSEGTGRMTSKDKQHFYTIARGSVFESVAIINLMKELGQMDEKNYQDIYNDFESCSKMLLAMYRSQNRV